MQSTRWLLGAAMAALFVLAPSTTAHAQTLSPGTRVRVHSSQVVAPITGSYQGMRRDTVIVIEDGLGARVWTFTSPAVDRLEISAGMKPGNRGPTVRAGGAAGWPRLSIRGYAIRRADDSGRRTPAWWTATC